MTWKNTGLSDIEANKKGVTALAVTPFLLLR